jgi:hypothetical protein
VHRARGGSAGLSQHPHAARVRLRARAGGVSVSR